MLAAGTTTDMSPSKIGIIVRNEPSDTEAIRTAILSRIAEQVFVPWRPGVTSECVYPSLESTVNDQLPAEETVRRDVELRRLDLLITTHPEIITCRWGRENSYVPIVYLCTDPEMPAVPTEFNAWQVIYNQFRQSELPALCDQLSDIIKKGLKLKEDVTQLVRQNSLFTPTVLADLIDQTRKRERGQQSQPERSRIEILFHLLSHDSRAGDTGIIYRAFEDHCHALRLMGKQWFDASVKMELPAARALHIYSTLEAKVHAFLQHYTNDASRAPDRGKIRQEHGGTTLSEEGIRVGIIKERHRVEPTDLLPVFIRNVTTRKGVPAADICRVRYEVSRHAHDSRVGDTLVLQGKTPWAIPVSWKGMQILMQDYVVGPDLSQVYQVLRNHCLTKPNEKVLCQEVRDTLIKIYLGRLAGWQRHPIPLEKWSATANIDPQKTVAYYVENHFEVGKTLELLGTSQEKILLWNACAQLYNAKDLHLPKTLRPSLDSSPQNAILRTWCRAAEIEDILKLARTPLGNVSDSKLGDNFYHVDVGYVFEHFLEGYFHIVDAAEAVVTEKDEQHAAAVSRNLRKYKMNFAPSVRQTSAETQFWIMGVYRNIRRAGLIAKNQLNNITVRNSGEYNYRQYKQDENFHAERWQHHIMRATEYARRGELYFEMRMRELRKNRLSTGLQTLTAQQDELLKAPLHYSNWAAHLALAAEAMRSGPTDAARLVYNLGAHHCLYSLLLEASKLTLPRQQPHKK